VRQAAAACALLVALALPGVAGAAKVRETAPPVTLPGAPPGPPLDTGNVTQSFELKGAKVRGKQVLDVNVVANATIAAPNSLALTSMILIGPSGDESAVLVAGSAQTWSQLKFDDQSLQFGCDPALTSSSRCNYVQAGTLSGSVNATINPFLKGLRPKGTWTLFFQTFSSAPVQVGETTLEVKTGKKFKREGK